MDAGNKHEKTPGALHADRYEKTFRKHLHHMISHLHTSLFFRIANPLLPGPEPQERAGTEAVDSTTPGLCVLPVTSPAVLHYAGMVGGRKEPLRVIRHQLQLLLRAEAWERVRIAVLADSRQLRDRCQPQRSLTAPWKPEQVLGDLTSHGDVVARSNGGPSVNRCQLCAVTCCPAACRSLRSPPHVVL